MRPRIVPTVWKLLVLSLAYFVVMFFGRLPDHLILFPTTAPIDAGAAVRKTVPFEKGELEIWTARSQSAQQQGRADVFILRFYGNADRADRWAAMEAEMWNNRAVEIWGINYPGFGGSTGPARLMRIGPAAVAAFDTLRREAADAPIIAYGASIGATVALHVAASRPADIAGLILHNPPPLREMILRQFGWWNLWLLAGPVASQIPRDLDSIANARASRAPAIFLLAEKDEIVAPRFHRLVVQAYAGDKRVIELRGAHHNDPVEGSALADLNDALGWLLTKASPQRAP
ncbi:MAG TPA: alpha/beta fold hydrolase [Candidatus Acidoferrum sp.]|nr:alpha/beta fold hydrolase [Candidatus Acidoferrum sp.]